MYLYNLFGPRNRLSIQDVNGLEVAKLKRDYQTYHSFDYEYLTDNIKNLLPGGTMTVRLEAIKIPTLIADLENIMNDLSFADCEIKTLEGTIKCHKVLLSRSCVFKEFSFVNIKVDLITKYFNEKIDV